MATMNRTSTNDDNDPVVEAAIKNPCYAPAVTAPGEVPIDILDDGEEIVDGLATTDNEAELAEAIANLPKLRKPTGNSFSPVWNDIKLITDARTRVEIPGKTHICQFCNHYLKLHWNESKAVKRSRGGGVHTLQVMQEITSNLV